jgi:hypothetical protein
LSALLAAVVASFRGGAALQIEILALRHQLGVLQRSVKRPKLTPADRLLWAWLCAAWNDCVATGNRYGDCRVTASGSRWRAEFKLPEGDPEAEFGEAAEVVAAGVSAKFPTNA